MRTLAAVALAAVVAIGATACDPLVPIPTAPGTDRVVIVGDSVPNWAIRDGKAGIDTKRITLVDGTLAACEGAKDNPPARGRDQKVLVTPPACKPGWPGMYPPYLTVHADVAVLMAGTHAMLDHQLSGTWRHPCHAPFKSWYQADVTARLKYLKTKADDVVLVLPAWPGPKSGWIMPADWNTRADCTRATLKAAAKAAGARIVDFGAYLCPTGETSCNSWRSTDGIHIDKAKAATVVRWLLTQADPVPPVTTTTTAPATTSTTTTAPPSTTTTSTTTEPSTTTTAPASAGVR